MGCPDMLRAVMSPPLVNDFLSRRTCYAGVELMSRSTPISTVKFAEKMAAISSSTDIRS